MRRGPRGLWLFVVLSVSVHVVFMVLSPRPQLKAAEEPTPTEVEFSLVAPPEPTQPATHPEVPAPEAAVAAALEPHTTKRRNQPALPPPVEVARVEPAPEASSPEEAPAPALAPPAAVSGKPLDLSPRAAALSMITADTSTSAPHCSAERQPSGAESCGASDVQAHAQAELDRNLRAIANDIPHLKAREKPQLQRKADGSYEYVGHVFRADVGRDGLVNFTDAAAKGGLQAGSMPVKFTMDVNDLANSLAHKELYTEEKRWFLEQTAELRARLSDVFRAEEAARARRGLELELERILAAHDMTASQRRSAVFALWQDCGEDGQAQTVRRIVEAFVRRRMPQGSEFGFSPQDLEQLNAARSGMRSFFAPYRTASGGAPG